MIIWFIGYTSRPVVGMSRLVPQLISWLTGHHHPQQADAEPFERLFHALLLHVVAVSLRFHAVTCGYMRTRVVLHALTTYAQ